MTQPDEPVAVRPETAFDVAAFAAWLGAREPSLAAEPELLQFGRGFSNLTYLLRYGDRELVLRRAPPGVHIKSAHDMGREFRILRALNPVWSKVPRAIAYCEDDGVIGSSFYVMERVHGVILRAPTTDAEHARRRELSPPRMRVASEALCDALAEIHSLDWKATELRTLGKPEGYVERQVRGWSERYGKARTDDVPEMERLGAWLEAHRLPESGAALVHNDFKYDNVVLSPDLARVTTVLDWEMATIGDPLMDLGTALGYWVEPGDPAVLKGTASVPSDLPGNLTRAEFVARWARATGRDASDALFYFAFALFKLGVVKQQLYKRWTLGLTTEPRYANMLAGVRAVATSALLAIERGRIDRLDE